VFRLRRAASLLEGFDVISPPARPPSAAMSRRALVLCALLAVPTSLAHPALGSLPYFLAMLALVAWLALMQGEKSTARLDLSGASAAVPGLDVDDVELLKVRRAAVRFKVCVVYPPDVICYLVHPCV
jgi:hypothetical protein